MRSLFTIIIFSVLIPSSVQAEEQSERENVEHVIALDERARVLFEGGDHQGALSLLNAAQELSPASPRLYNMAVCHEELGHEEEALELYQTYLESPDVSPDRIERVTEAIERLQPANPDPENSWAQGDSREPDTTSGRLPRGLFWAMAGLTAASGLSMAITGGVALAKHNEFEPLYSDANEYEVLQSQGQRLTIATDVLLGLTAASALATLVIAFFTDWGGPSVAISPSSDGLSCGLTGRF